MMKMDEFSNGIRILFNIDYDEFVASVVTWDVYIGDDAELDKQWRKFRTDPVNYFLSADDKTAGNLWRIIKAREERRKAA